MLTSCGSEDDGLQTSEKLVTVMSVGVRYTVDAEEEAICPLVS